MTRHFLVFKTWNGFSGLVGSGWFSKGSWFCFSLGFWILLFLQDVGFSILVFSELDLKEFNTWTVGLTWMTLDL